MTEHNPTSALIVLELQENLWNNSTHALNPGLVSSSVGNAEIDWAQDSLGNSLDRVLVNSRIKNTGSW